jgi:glutamate-5-semialdehyde dehydrogenase
MNAISNANAQAQDMAPAAAAGSAHAPMQILGQQAKVASAAMAKASTASKNNALKRLAALLRENTDALQIDNAKDLARAEAAGLAAPMVDRLRLSPKVLATCAEG